MSRKEFYIEDFIEILSELFEVDKSVLSNEYDLSTLIKDSIDLGELVAVIKKRHDVSPKDWQMFKTETRLDEVFSNFG